MAKAVDVAVNELHAIATPGQGNQSILELFFFLGLIQMLVIHYVSSSCLNMFF